MTEFELLQLIKDWSELASLTEAAFLTLLFAYLIAAHLVGAKLTRLQLYIVSIIYAFALLRTTAAHFAQLSRIVEFGDRLGELGSDYTVQIPSFAPYLIVAVWLTGFAASIFYMRTCRKGVAK